MNPELRMLVQLLVAFNGRQRVLEELASIEAVDVASLEREIEAIRSRVAPKAAATRKPRRRKTALELTRDVALNDDIRSVVEHLAGAYDEKGFLPDMWRVRQFLESHGIPADKIRSRGDALPKVVRVLAKLSPGELDALGLELRDNRSDLSILTDHILGPADRKHPRHSDTETRPTSWPRAGRAFSCQGSSRRESGLSTDKRPR